LLRAVASCADKLPVKWLALVAKSAAAVECFDESIFLEAAARRIVDLCSSRDLFAKPDFEGCTTVEVIWLLWTLTQYQLCYLMRREAASASRGPGFEALVWAAGPLLNACADLGVDVLNADLARLCWAMGHLRAGSSTPLLRQLAVEAVCRAEVPHDDDFALLPDELADIAWGLAVLGARPNNSGAFLVAAGHLCKGMAVGSLTRLVAALGTFSDSSDSRHLRSIFACLRCQVGGCTADELMMVACATVRLDVQDDALMRAIQQRAQHVGPFDSKGASEITQTFVEYWQRWGTDDIRAGAAGFGVLAMRHGGVNVNFASPCWGPPSLHDERMQRLLSVQRLTVSG